ncbi:MAG: 16S rRNA (guanine(527)-N(7))-methyltransferase RsmG [Candidatus Acidiferrales bacterium]
MAQRRSSFSETLIRSALEPYEVQLTRELAAHISAYAELLSAWNRKISLTSLHDPIEILKVHFGESLFAAHLLQLEEGRLADVGSGAGFPGLVLKVYRPKLHLTLIEANSKKAAFLSEVVRKLGIGSVRVFCGRMETYPEREGQFDFITCRAVGRFEELLYWASKTLATQGAVVLWAGDSGIQKIRREPGWSWEDPARLPESGQRYVLIGRPSSAHC